MGHNLSAVIGPTEQIEEFASRWVRARPVRLPQRFALVPVTLSLREDIEELADSDDPDPFDTFASLTAALALALAQASRGGILGYIETEYFGGVGTQCAICWRDGRISTGPQSSETTWSGSEHIRTPAGNSAIHQVLVDMGVTTRAGQDAFDALHLGRFRATE